MKPKPIKIYKIQNKDGLFSVGGTDYGYKSISFSKTGKAWTALQHIKSHIKNLKIVGSDWEVVEYELVEVKRYKATEFKSDKSITSDEAYIKDIVE